MVVVDKGSNVGKDVVTGKENVIGNALRQKFLTYK